MTRIAAGVSSRVYTLSIFIVSYVQVLCVTFTVFAPTEPAASGGIVASERCGCRYRGRNRSEVLEFLHGCPTGRPASRNAWERAKCPWNDSRWPQQGACCFSGGTTRCRSCGITLKTREYHSARHLVLNTLCVNSTQQN